MARDEQQAASQLDIEGQINAALKKRSEILKAQSKYLSGQVQIAMEMCNAMNCEGLEGMQDRLAEIQEGMKSAADEAKKLEQSAAGAGESMKKAAGGATKKGGALSKVFSPMGGMFAGLGVGMMSAFKGATNMVGGFLSSAMRIPGIIGNVGKALITLPFSLLNNLTSLAAGAGGGVSALRQAMEEVREEFGSLAKNEGKQVMDGFNSMKSQMKEMSKQSPRLAKHFGYGSEGMANRLKATSEQMKDLGVNMHQFGKDVAQNSGYLHVYRKGLGLTGDAFAAMGTLAATKGKGLTETVHEVGSMAINMGKQFGIGPKELSKSMATMAGDVANFGTLSVKQLGALAVYTKKLGIEAKELTGVIDKFDNFEDAAKSASQLSSAFGMNIDAMKMMKEQDPGKRMDMLRESFQATGKSVEDLSRQELKLLSAQMGLSEEAAKRALSSDLDYDELTAGADDAEAKTISQAEAMKELADSLKQVFGGGGGGPKTFMEALTSGFKKGIMRGKGMRKMFSNIRKSMRQTYLFGKDLGKMFIEMFPGIQDMIKGLTELFSPARFKKLRTDLLGAFKQLFVDLRTDPQAGVENFSERIKKIFGDFFDSSKGPGKTFMKGLKTFGKTVLLLILNLIPVLMKGFASLIKKLADFIKDPSAFADAGVGISDGLNKALMQAWENIKMTAPILGEAFGALWEAVKPSLGKLWNKIWPYLLSAVILKSVIAVAANMTLGTVFGVLFKGFAKLFGGAMSKGAAAGGKKAEKTMTKGGGFINSLKKVIRDIAKLKISDVMKAIANVAILIIFLGVSLVGLAFALKTAVNMVADVDSTKLAIMTALLIATMMSMLPISQAAIALKAVSWKDMAVAVVKIGIAMGGLALLTLAVAAAISIMPEIGMGQIINFFAVLGTIFIASAIAIALAIPVGNLAKSMGGQLVQGLVILGAVMVGLGVIGGIVGGILSLIPNPGGVAKLMNAISILLITTALMLPIAGGLGLMLMSFPFGTAGIGVLLAGFGVLATMVTALVGSVLPAIKEIANAKIENPDKVKTVVDMIVNVINAIANFTGQFARVLEALKPPPESASDQMAKNIIAAKDLLDALLKNGINQVIEKIISLSKSTDITGMGVQAAQAVAAVLSAIGSIMGAIQPNQGMMKDVMAGIDDDDVDEFMRAASTFTANTSSGLNTLMDKLTAKGGLLSDEFIQSANKITGPGIEFVKAIVPLFGAIGSMTQALQPDPKIFQAIKGAIDDDDYDDFMREMTRFSSSMGSQFTKMIGAFAPAMKKVIDAVGGMIKAIPAGKEKTLEAVGPIIGPLFTAMGEMMSGVFPIVNAVIKGASDNKGRINTRKLKSMTESIGAMFTAMGDSLAKMGPSLGKLVKAVVDAAEGIKDPEKVKPKIEVISDALAAVKNLMEMFNPDTSNVFSAFVSSADKVQYSVNGQRVSQIGAAIYNMNNFTDKVLQKGGPLERLVQALGNVTISDAQAKNVKKIKPALDALGTIFNFVKTVQGLKANKLDDVSEVTKMINKTFAAMIKVKWQGKGDTLQGLLEKISGGNWKYSIATIKARVKAMKELTAAVTEIQSLETVLKSVKDMGVGTTYYKYMSNTITWVEWLGNATVDNITKELAGKVNASTKVVKAMVKNFNEINKLLAKAPAVNMTAALNTFGENMSIGTETVRIQNKPINITVDLHVTMSADAIATSLAKPGRKNRVALSTKGGQALTPAGAGFNA